MTRADILTDESGATQSSTAGAAAPAGAGTGQTITDAEFEALVAPLRRELIAHCYRMLGSSHEAEDMVQETYLRAWRAFGAFEGRSSVRTWMYQIATRTCLTALGQRGRRPLPSGLGGDPSDPVGTLETAEVPWLEPLPDRVEAADPATTAVSRDGVRLAFVAALQKLTPPQRAVLVLRDVLGFSAAETAETLDISVASANSALQRARAHAGDTGPIDAAELSEHDRELLDRYVKAFEDYDVKAIVSTLADDAIWQMPPFTGWYSGAENIGRLIAANCPAQGPDDQRLIPTTANGQPAFGLYMRGDDGVHRPFQLQVVEVDGGLVTNVVAFFDLTLFEKWGLPATA
jgi:RNA polymerase sigma-70 factor (ECF subfamily)